MRNVVDANLLRHPALEEYLQTHPSHQVVFTEYACMECYKGNALSNIQRSLAIVAKYPEQVIVLKGTRDIIRLQAQGPHTQDAFIDVQQTAGFRSFVRHVQAAARGDKDLHSKLVLLAKAAKAHFRERRDDAAGVAIAIRETARTLLPSQLAELRREGPLSQETGAVLVKNVLAGS